MLALTLPRKTPAHGVPAGAKLAALAVASVAVFPVQDIATLCILLIAIALLHLSLGRDVFAYALRMLRPILFFALIIAGYHLLAADIVRGAGIVLRMVILVALANLVTMTTALNDMIAVLETLLRPLARLGVNTRAISLSFAMVVRFTPVLIEKGGYLIESWRARSPKRPNWRVTIPVCILALDDAEHIGEALRARGGVTGPKTKRT